ncbi:hypothetical protein [Streptomyces sp. JJ36]|uniref:hypothetical protein n=1 Tax=Streptomyces sp. JJ36 TaxID=2736645 RepID=UPI001F3B1AF9|nr:hypothetical protein [Streptomyces sp. JJ36]MCF6524799.1 hypothetical protein [Streptomyces sp. JJ36]
MQYPFGAPPVVTATVTGAGWRVNDNVHVAAVATDHAGFQTGDQFGQLDDCPVPFHALG